MKTGAFLYGPKENGSRNSTLFSLRVHETVFPIEGLPCVDQWDWPLGESAPPEVFSGKILPRNDWSSFAVQFVSKSTADNCVFVNSSTNSIKRDFPVLFLPIIRLIGLNSSKPFQPVLKHENPFIFRELTIIFGNQVRAQRGLKRQNNKLNAIDVAR